MIKIAFVIDTIESPTAGTEKQLLLLIKNLDRKKYLPYLCVLRTSRWLREEFCDCELHEVGIASFKNPVSYNKIRRFISFLRLQKIDIVQTYFNDSNKAGILAARLAGTRSVISSRRNQGYWHTPIELFFLKILNRWVDVFVANSFSTQKWVQNAEGIAAEKIKVIYNGFDLYAESIENAQQQRQELRSVLNMSEKSPLVGQVANLRPVKRHDVFLRAAQSVVVQYPETHFVIVGEGGERPALEQLANELKISNQVHFLGKRDDVTAILNALDVGVLSSDSESFSNAVVEYLASGLPVVSTDVGGSREAIDPGKNGYIVPTGDYEAMADALCRIISGNLGVEMGKRGRIKAESLFSMEAMVTRYQELYDNLSQNKQVSP